MPSEAQTKALAISATSSSRVGIRAEPAREVARQPRGMAGPVTKLVKAGSVIIDLLEEGGLRRHLDEIGGVHIEGVLSADAEIGLRRFDQRFGMGDEVALGKDRRTGKEMVRQAVALGDIEDGEALEERDGFGLAAFLPRALQFILGNEAVGVANRRAALAFADIAAQVQRLPEGEPMLMGKALLDNRAPEDQDVDPGIAPTGGGILGQAQAGLAVAPGLHPRHSALLHLGDDLVGDLLIEAGLLPPIRARTLAIDAHALTLRSDQKPRAFPESGVGGEMRPQRPAVRGGPHRQAGTKWRTWSEAESCG